MPRREPAASAPLLHAAHAARLADGPADVVAASRAARVRCWIRAGERSARPQRQAGAQRVLRVHGALRAERRRVDAAGRVVRHVIARAEPVDRVGADPVLDEEDLLRRLQRRGCREDRARHCAALVAPRCDRFSDLDVS
eukprot:6303800-Prymnesium_polylepis.2